MLTKHHHRPAHLFLDETYYFITGAIYKKRHLLIKNDTKVELVKFFRKFFKKFNWQLEHWVILNNHYHLIGKSRKGKNLTDIFRSIHSCSAISISKETNCEKPVWWNYWDYCPRNEKEYFTRLNYLLYNPIKHGYVNDLHDYPFSSFFKLFDEMGREKLAKQFHKYPKYKTLILEEAMNDNF